MCVEQTDLPVDMLANCRNFEFFRCYIDSLFALATFSEVSSVYCIQSEVVD